MPWSIAPAVYLGGRSGRRVGFERGRVAPVTLETRVLLAKQEKTGHLPVTGTQRYVGLEELQGSTAAWEYRVS